MSNIKHSLAKHILKALKQDVYGAEIQSSVLAVEAHRAALRCHTFNLNVNGEPQTAVGQSIRDDYAQAMIEEEDALMEAEASLAFHGISSCLRAAILEAMDTVN